MLYQQDFHQMFLSIKYPVKVRRPDYNEFDEVRKVKLHGEISYQGKRWFLTEILQGEKIGLRKIEDDKMQVYYYSHPIAKLNLLSGQVEKNNCQKKHYKNGRNNSKS